MITIDYCVRNIITYEELEKLINPLYLEIMETFVPESNLVYTSFDGDYMHYLHYMQEYSMQKGYVPINPEAALGYYVSTVSHSDEKIPVMMDCIKTELLCDYMWIFNPCSGHVPEGVLAELMIWNTEKHTEVSVIDFFPDEIDHIDILGRFSVQNLGKREIDDIVKKRSSAEVSEINTKLLEPYKKKLLKNAYIIANFHNYKHIDWARNYCYRHQISPVCAQTLLPYYLYSKPEFGNKRYLCDRLNLLNRAENVFLFINTRRIKEEISKLDEFSLCEIYYVLKYRKDMKIVIVGWDEASVPKYKNSARWAVTSIEALEV